MANFSSDQKYLDKYGLSLFWDKVRQYIQNQIGGIDGTDVKLYPSGETNPTVTDQIEKLWNSIGSGELEGGISGSIEAILGQYVKDIQHADSQTTPLKVVVNEGTGNEADFYTVTLEDNGLANILSDLTSNRVSSLLNPVNGGGSVTLAVDKNKGDVTLTINSQELTNKVSGLETTIDGMVKSVNKAENGDGAYVKLNIDPTTGDVKLSINDQSLVSELTSIKDNYVKTENLPTTLPNPSKLKVTNASGNVVEYDGSSVVEVDSISHSNTSNDSDKLDGHDSAHFATAASVNGLGERLTAVEGYVQDVNAENSNTGTKYVTVSVTDDTDTATNGKQTKITINDSALTEKISNIENNYAKTEDLPSTLPNPHKFTLTYRDKENQEKVVIYDGSSAKDVDFSLYHATTSTTATRVSNALKVVDARGNAYDYNGGIMVDLSDGINYAANSGKLGGQLPSYYGKQSDITTISQKIAELEALTHVNQITAGDGASDLVKIGFDVSTGNVVASIDETNLSNKLTSIDNYTINSKKISTNPVLTGSDITLGTTVGDNVNYPTTTTLTSSIQKLRETIAGLGQVVELKGVLSSLPATTEGYGNGDVVIVGNKEYICYNSTWYLLGDTTELSQNVSTIKSSYVKSIKATGTGVTVSPTTSSTGDVTINVDATPITNAISELEANFGNYLPLSGGTMTGNLVTKQISVRAGNWVITNGQGISLQRSDGPSYIWNNTTNQSISIGTKAIGDTSEANASLVIKGTNVYPGPNETINLGIDAHTFNNIKGNRIQGKKFISGPYSRSSFESDITTGLQISTQIAKSDNNTAGDYGFPVVDNANGVLSLKVHPSSESNTNSLAWHNHYLGFSGKGLYYKNPTIIKWTKLNEPSILSISVPEIEYSSSTKIIPEIIHDNITNVFHDIQQTKILIERSQDGITWADTTETDYPKFKQVMSSGKAPSGVPVVAYNGANGQVGDRVRITINGASAYAKLAYIYVYYTTQGATTKLTVEKNTYSAQDTWVTIVDKEKVTGWSGPNYYGLENSYIGQFNGDNGYSYRLTFEITAVSSGQTNLGYLNSIWAISSDRPWSITADPNKMFYFNVGRWKHVTNKSIEPVSDVTCALGSSNYRWSAVYAKDFYGILHTPNGTSNHFVKGNGTISTHINVTHDAASASPLNQAICVNATTGTDDIIKMPGIGFHNPGKSYATLKYTGTFEFMNETLTDHKNVKAAKFITTGGTSSQVVLGDGTLKAISDISIGNADTVDGMHASDFAHKQEFTIGANKYAKITGSGIFTAFISVGSTLGSARHMSCWSSYGSGQSIRTNIKHIINGTDIYIDESDTGPIIYIKGYSQQTVIHILCSLSSFTCEELSSLPANISITNTNSNNYTLAVKSDIPTIPTSLKNPYSLTIQKNGTNVATYDGSEAKTANITVALSDVPHTHTVPKTGTTALVASKSNHSHTASSNGAHTHTVSGTVTSSLSGASAASSGPSVSYSATTGVLTITMNHTHTVSGTVTSSLSGAVAASDGAHTHTVPADTKNIISVASQEHTHTTGQAQ